MPFGESWCTLSVCFPVFRKVFILFTIQGFTIEETAAVLRHQALAPSTLVVPAWVALSNKQALLMCSRLTRAWLSSCFATAIRGIISL